MHPLDRVHDTTFDKHDVKKAVRRTSLDNSCLQDKQDVLAKMITGSTCLDDSNHEPVRRRLSLNNVMAKPTTFLATPAGDHQPKTELDMDYHVGEDNDDENDGDSGLPDSNSFVCQSSFGELGRGHVISEDEEDKDESSLLTDGDSFCEATGSEPANREYIVKELGASCFWDGDGDGDHNISDAELAEFEALENGEHESTENGLENLEELTDEHSDCDSFCEANEKEPANREYLVRDLGASCFWGSSDGLDMGIESTRRPPQVRPVTEGGQI